SLQEAMAARIAAPPSAERDSGVALDEWLCAAEPACVAERMRIYIDGYPARVHDALAESYPAIAHLVGADAFSALAQRYAAAVPLRSYNLTHAGAQLPAFLSGDAVTHDWPYLPDLARLEWSVARAFHADEREPLDLRALEWSVDDWADAILH